MAYSNGEIIIDHRGSDSFGYPFTLKLYSVDGRLIQSNNISSGDEDGIIKVPAKGLPTGCYIASLAREHSSIYSEMICCFHR